MRLSQWSKANCRKQLESSATMSLLLALAFSLVWAQQMKAASPAKDADPTSERRVLVFPQDTSIGRVELRNLLRPDEVQDLGEARGTMKVSIAPNHYVLIHPGKTVQLNPTLLRKAPGKGIEAIKLKFYSLGEEDQGHSITDKIVKELPQFQDLERLDLSQSDVTDKGLEALEKLPKLRKVNLFQTEIHGSCLQTLKKLPKLEELDISFDPIESKYLSNLKDMEKLKFLNVRRIGAGLEAAKYVGQCKSVVVLNIGHNRQLTDACVDSLLSLTNLRELSLDGTSLTKEGALKFKALKLVDIELPSCFASERDYVEAKKALGNVQIFRPGLRPVTRQEQWYFAPLH